MTAETVHLMLADGSESSHCGGARLYGASPGWMTSFVYTTTCRPCLQKYAADLRRALAEVGAKLKALEHEARR
jgi:hypothetical protein